MFGHFFLILIFALLYKVSFIRRHLGKYLFWGTLIRLFTEGFFEIALLSILNPKTFEWDSPFRMVNFSNFVSLFAILMVAFLPLYLVCFYAVKKDKWNDDNFQQTSGALLEDYKLNSKVLPKTWVLIVVFSFFVRRLIFVLGIFYLESLSLNLFLQMSCTMAVLVLLLALKPLAESKAQRLEVFNECTILALNYILLFFSDAIGTAADRSTIGYVYLAISFQNISVHLLMMICSSLLALKLYLMRKCCKQTLAKNQAKQKEKYMERQQKKGSAKSKAKTDTASPKS